MPKRWHKNKRRRLAGRLLRRDGFLCLICLRPLRFPFATGYPAADASDLVLEIDHVNNTPGRDILAELALLCAACNVRERNYRESGRARVLTLSTLELHCLIARARANALVGAEVFDSTPGSNSPSRHANGVAGAELSAEPSPAPPEEASASPPSEHHPPPEAQVTGVREREREDAPARVEEREAEAVRVRQLARLSVEHDGVDAHADDAAILTELVQPLFRCWVFVTLVRRGALAQADILDGGSNYLIDHVGRGVQITVSRYLRACANPINGWITSRLDERNKVVWTLRGDLDTAARYTLLYGRVLALSSQLSGAAPWLVELELNTSELSNLNTGGKDE